MPERWERELDELRHMEMREPAIRERIERGPTGDRGSSRKHSLVAGIVAGAVAVAGIAALWQLDRNPEGIGDATVDLPALVVTFQSGRMLVDQPDEQIQRVDTTIVYGDAREEDFTSTISESAHVDWVGVEDLTRFVPGPTAGSQVRFDADGEDARVLIGRPEDWPEFDRFTEIDRLPEEPGDYVLVFEATYAEGVARTARFVQIVAPGTMQLAVTTQGWDATADAYVDGAANGWPPFRIVGRTDRERRWRRRIHDPSFRAGGRGPSGSRISDPPGDGVWRMLEAGSSAGTTPLISVPRCPWPSRMWSRRPHRGSATSSLLRWVGTPPVTGHLAGRRAALFLFPIEIVDPSKSRRHPRRKRLSGARRAWCRDGRHPSVVRRVG